MIVFIHVGVGSMKGFISLKSQILLSFWIMAGLAAALHFFLLHRDNNDRVLRTFEESSIRELELVHWMLVDSGPPGSIDELQARIGRIAEKLGVRITCVGEDGRVTADSSVPPSDIASLDNHANRPEVVQAMQHGMGVSERYSGTLETKLLYVAKSVEGGGGVGPWVLRLAIPYTRVSRLLDAGSRPAMVIFIASLLLAGTIMGTGVTRRLKGSLKSMAMAVEAIGRGEQPERLDAVFEHELNPLAVAIKRTTDGMNELIHEVSAHERELAAILDGMCEGVILLDMRGKIHTANRAFKGMAPDIHNIEGRHPLEVIRDKGLQDAVDLAVASANRGRPNNPDSFRITLAGGRVYEVNINMVDGGLREDHGVVVVFHDISEITQLEKIRRDFVANASHELRTPLTSIKGYAETLLTHQGEECDPEAGRRFLEVILRNADRMGKMVTELLELAKLESSASRHSGGPIGIGEAFAAAWEMCAPMAEARHLRLRNELPRDGVEAPACFDQIVQVFRNLLENAVRCSPESGEIAVSCSLDERFVVIGVIDEGPGIPPFEQSRIFERFYRVEKSRAGDSGSTGLGLAICRHIVRNHGGKIWVESPPKGSETGAALYFSLPVAHADSGV